MVDNHQQFQWVQDRIQGIADGSLQRITIREIRKMIRIMQGNNSILGNLSQPNLNRNISTERIQGISIQMIMPVNSLRERQDVRNRWINATRYAITIYSNNNNSSSSSSSNNNTRTINSKKSSGTKLSTPTRKRLKKTPTTPQSKLKK
jgi:hypothetical protein|tara:strand:- start:3990 stop:4433 length:444 start_codon:yes stop_codon:yes gene_type:complete